MALLLAAGLAAAPPPAAKRPNVVLFFIDTLRARQVHCLGYPRTTTDSLDQLAGRGVLFETAISASGWSLPSFSAVFTSMPPPSQGNQEIDQVVDPSVTSLADIYNIFGYRTAGFVAGGHLSSAFGLSKGFKTYLDRPHFGSFYHTVPEALDWLRKSADERPFLLFVQGYDCHLPYRVPLGFAETYDRGYKGIVHERTLLEQGAETNIQNNVYHSLPGSAAARGASPAGLPAGESRPFAESPRQPGEVAGEGPVQDVPLTPADVAHIVAHYDGAVTYADAWLGVFLENLERMGHKDDTIVLVAGDHGEELGEHGEFGHRHGLSECLIHVPLVIAGPGIAHGRRIPDVVELLDLAPTLLDLCGIPPSQTHKGRSLRPYLDSTKSPLVETDRVAFSSRATTLSARTRRWHLTLDGAGRSLFDIEADPTEQHDLNSKEKDVADKLASLAREWEERYRTESKPTAAPLTDAEKAIFRKHGYW